MTSRQLTECIAYNTVEPFGHDTLYFLIGQLISLTYNINKGKNSPTKGPWDFIPFMRQPNKKQDSNTIKDIMMLLVNETDPNKKKEVPVKVTQTNYYKKRMKKYKQKQLEEQQQGRK